MKALRLDNLKILSFSLISFISLLFRASTSEFDFESAMRRDIEPILQEYNISLNDITLFFTERAVKNNSF